jgi:4-cresol dehydrogenase (hydroxylating)
MRTTGCDHERLVNVMPHSERGASAAAVKELTSALGDGAVLTDGDFGDPYAPAEWTDLRPAVVVQPTSVEEVQAVVRIAGEHRLTLWPVSRGKNNGYGGSAVADPGSVLVHLGRMNKVIEVNEELAYAVVEPGVSFYDLYDELGRRGHRLWAAVPDLGWGSVMGKALDHGMGYMPNGDRAASVCGMEVVLADGTLIRTGMGAMEGSPSWHLSKRGFGPALDSLFMQSNFGIVTKVGIWLMPKPQVYSSCRVSVSDDGDLEALVDTLRPLILDGTITGQPAIFGPAPHAGWVAGPWTLRFGLYGREAEVDLKIATIRDAFTAIDGASVYENRYDGQPPPEAWQTDKVHAGVPSQDQIDEIGLDDPDLPLGHTVFSSVVPNTGAHVRAITELFRRHTQPAGLPAGQSIVIHGRYITNLGLIAFPRGDRQAAEAVFEIYRAMVLEATALGYGEYRTHVRTMDLVAEQFGFNDHALQRTTEKIKDALDPNGVLAPGKSGIWPGWRRSTGQR